MKASGIASLLAVLLCAGAGAAEEKPNLAPNPGFESPAVAENVLPEGWNLFTSKSVLMNLSTDQKRSGEQALKMTAQGVPEGFQGCHFPLDVSPGEKYTLAASLMSSKEDPIGGSAFVILVIEWKTDADKEIARTVGRQIPATQISRMRWEQFAEQDAVAPPGAVKGVFGVHLCEGKPGGKGSLFVDDVSVTRK